MEKKHSEHLNNWTRRDVIPFTLSTGNDGIKVTKRAAQNALVITFFTTTLTGEGSSTTLFWLKLVSNRLCGKIKIIGKLQWKLQNYPRFIP